MNSRRSFLQSFAAIVSSASLGRMVGRSIVDSSNDTIEQEASPSLEVFSDRTHRVLQFAKDEAVGLGHAQVGTEHLLIALFSESEQTDSKWLEGLRAQAQDFRDVVECLNSTTVSNIVSDNSAISLSESKSLLSTLKTAFEIASKNNRSKVQPAHLLLAILESKQCSARQILTEMWFDERQLRRFAQRQIG